MVENSIGENTQKDRNKKWEMAFTARMRQIGPGLFLGNASRDHINSIVCLTDARWVWWKSTVFTQDRPGSQVTA